MLAVTRCEMMDPRHPDDPGPDRYCVEAAIGRTEDKVYVCEKCAVMMIRDGFTVHPLDYVFKEKEKICTRPCTGCGQPVTSSFDACACTEAKPT